MSNQRLQLQELVHEYFKDLDDFTFVQVSDKLVFAQQKKAMSLDAEARVNLFLKENGLDKELEDYVSDLDSNRLLLKSSDSYRSVMSDIQTAFLVESANRLRKLVFTDVLANKETEDDT